MTRNHPPGALVAALLHAAAERATAYLGALPDRSIVAPAEAVERLGTLVHALPREGLAAADVLQRLDAIGSPATVATSGGRYFGHARACRFARTFAESLSKAGYDILNEVVLNQVRVVSLQAMLRAAGNAAVAGR
ncbi:hypothetical protein [Cupriavidus plantarum]|uniref:Uncharacterized protein n=1 Tax=Cupriavidus plantarum TaxID=942865 RepID=A0A316EMV2_9BURK|nr:hypothetical protein [Cupriavidus plantarum]PWK33831.1 hypothetical protein C7419_103150 [Cupriavidus plantarum]